MRTLNCVRILTRDKHSLQHNTLEEDIICLLKLARLIPQNLTSTGNLSNLTNTKGDDESENDDNENDNDDKESTRTIESLKCLCNLVYQSAECRKQCIRYYIVDRLIQRISTNEYQMSRSFNTSSSSLSLELYDMKLLFLLSALESMVRSRLVIELNGLTYMTERLDQKLSVEEDWSQQQIDITIDLLKVMYNIISHSEKSPPHEHEIQNLHLTRIIRRLLFRFGDNLEMDCIRLLISNCINLLIHMSGTCLIELLIKLDYQQQLGTLPKLIAFEGYNLYALSVLLKYLHLVVEGATKTSLNERRTTNSTTDALPPILSVLVKCASSHRIMRHYLRHIILPPLKRITQPPEVGSELRNHLCRLQSNCDQIVSELTSELLFICCKKNARRMVKYFGYGNMAGLFCRKGMLDCRRLGSADLENLSTDSEENSDTEEYKAIQPDINPITGFYHHNYPEQKQQKDHFHQQIGDPCKERPKSLSSVLLSTDASTTETRENAMTEEEKEYQAMQLVQVIDKLQKDGLITPCGIGEDGKLRPVEHILEMQEASAGFMKNTSILTSSTSSKNNSRDPFIMNTPIDGDSEDDGELIK